MTVTEEAERTVTRCLMLRPIALLVATLVAGSALAGVIVSTGPRLFVLADPPIEQEVGSLTTPGGTSNELTAFRVSRSNNAVDVGAAELTVELWLRVRSQPDGDNDQTGVTAGANYSCTEGNIFVDGDGFETGRGIIGCLDDCRLAMSVNNAGGTRTIIGTTDICDDQWGHVALQFRASDGLMAIYARGLLEATADGPDGSVAHGNGDSGDADEDEFWYFGAEKLSVGWGLDGDSSEVRISDVLRYDGSSYTVPSGPFAADENTVWLAHLDEGEGTTITDYSASGVNGSLTGSPLPIWSTDDPFED